MGVNHSLIKTSGDKLIINKSDVNRIDQTLNSHIIDTAIRHSHNCSSALNSNQNIELIGLKSGGDIDVTNTNKQVSVLDFSCVSNNSVYTESSDKMLREIMNSLPALEQTVQTRIESQSNYLTESGSIQGLAELIREETEHDIKSTTFERIVKNTIRTKFHVEQISNCIIKVTNSQTVQARNIQSGELIRVVIEQEQGINAVANCVSNQNIGNPITTELLNLFQVEVIDDTSTGSTIGSFIGGITQISPDNSLISLPVLLIITGIGMMFFIIVLIIITR